MSGRKMLLRAASVGFFVLAGMHWFSYNMAPIDATPAMTTNAIGWLWTVLIAAPGCLLWGLTVKR
jgi:hypothetical protein